MGFFWGFVVPATVVGFAVFILRLMDKRMKK
jgi:hypothetical protein